jgi:hypothetical protein
VFGALILLALGALVWMPSSGSARSARATALTMDPIRADFSENDRATTYSVPNVMDDTFGAARFSYAWTLTLSQVDPNVPVDPDCNNHGVLSGTATTFVWHHGNKDDPVHGDDNCDHAIYGQYGHQGLITVVVTDDQGFQCTETYKGTLSSDANSVANGIASERTCIETTPPPPPPPAPPPPPPPPGKRCQCQTLTASIVRSSLGFGLKAVSKHGINLVFEIHWTMLCTKGKLGCNAQLRVIAPRGEFDTKTGNHRYTTAFLDSNQKFARRLAIACRGNCGRLVGETEKLSLLGIGLGPKDRVLESIPIVIERTCRGRRAAIELSIAFDAVGQIDKANSKLH